MNVHLLNYTIWHIARELVLHHRYSLVDNDEGMLTLKRRDGMRVVYLYLMPLFYGSSAEDQLELIRGQLQESIEWMKSIGFRKPNLIARKIHLYIRTDAGQQNPAEVITELQVSSLTERYRVETWVADLVEHEIYTAKSKVPGTDVIEQAVSSIHGIPYDETELYVVINRWHHEMLQTHQERTQPFEEAGRKRGGPLTLLLAAINVLIWLAMTAMGGSSNPQTLIAFGAKFNPLIDQGEYWRLFTPIFLHVGGLHLWFNSVSLLAIGGKLERVLGSVPFIVIYLGAGIFGNVSSYMFSPSISAGASGAIFGLMGALLYLTWKEPDTWGETMGFSIWTGLIMNIILGFAIPAIDNYAHFGGLISGFIIAFLLFGGKSIIRAAA
ncbi:rhomboid family intramembrane serine protease [Paenibacillus roseipurpureus]|uniref:Rhomboid family intramembrane serine protease n=1 Tax=Paenibacillus roseopurpureus TaxID=2918901 RepID=A0AA96LQT5_9BACL|nr:rhomboid family intramembrane serine protease [Paenibacillus sp. MBLB1832]WNR44128.1 rhomboid family intramembrane serine protease [Paenibacillus sp. MBLB1832]